MGRAVTTMREAPAMGHRATAGTRLASGVWPAPAPGADRELELSMAVRHLNGADNSERRSDLFWRA